jgi:hypothetical protein
MMAVRHSARPEPVEGHFFFRPTKTEKGFDKLSPSGMGEEARMVTP